VGVEVITPGQALDIALQQVSENMLEPDLGKLNPVQFAALALLQQELIEMRGKWKDGVYLVLAEKNRKSRIWDRTCSEEHGVGPCSSCGDEGAV
jgi:hypothetical protein